MGRFETGANVILIGMPGAGKSTIGVLLAKRLGYGFIDTDILIQTQEGRTLPQIIAASGITAFSEIEARYTQAVTGRNQVVATGGSVVYAPSAMDHLKSIGKLYFLDLSLANLEARLGDLDARGVIRAAGQRLADVYSERQPLYHYHSDIRIDTNGLTPDQVVAQMAPHLGLSPP